MRGLPEKKRTLSRIKAFYDSIEKFVRYSGILSYSKYIVNTYLL